MFQRFCKWRSYSKLDRCAVSARKAGEFSTLTIKTSTGFDKEGANAEDIKLMKETIGNRNLKIKASGGISNTQDAINMINAGADRLGSSKIVSIGYSVAKFHEEKNREDCER